MKTKSRFKITYGLLTGDIVSYHTMFTHAYSAKQATTILCICLGKDHKRLRDVQVTPVIIQSPVQSQQLSMLI